VFNRKTKIVTVISGDHGGGAAADRIFRTCSPVLVPGYQWVDCPNSSTHLRYVTIVSKIWALQGISTDVLHFWWKSPSPPQNESTVVGNLKYQSISDDFWVSFLNTTCRTFRKETQKPNVSPNRCEILYFLLLLAVSNYGSGSHIYLFWQKSPVKLITNGSRPALRGDPSTFFGVFVTPQFVQALFTVYLLYELKVPGPFKDVQRKRPRP
jgi:hypothetical protein